MTYVVLYIAGIICIWWTYRVGWREAFKKILSILIPSALIILFNVKAGRLLFRSPIVGIISILPTAILIYRGSLPLVNGFNNWIDRKANNFTESQDVVDAEVISKEDA
ncbi:MULTISPECIES: membrane protein [Prochlorococcus]|uniref:Predicted membrane protein n=2 Tax=Prochlorococcus TaxID=1218 RepID=Q7VAD3_PROMA|nr:Predicted membrane protein [Prochlorococcus marinus subsp. marinus str. CCMP1375]KGG10938.1 hypothetical protein EV04_1902 [Prochlorococcus marinus str. LG]KGG20522.1 hypothetical protein EV08_1108 [Prochlorococcus marinus str. SS2]KGG24187.1 hypothetical protein EV09_0794 [Prochlorococcus marinus str. SS35]